MLITIAESVRGSQHIKTGKPLQDCASAFFDIQSCAYALVADGHGGEKYFRSADGSKLAVKCAVEAINKVLKELLSYVEKQNKDVIDKTLQNLGARILILWHERVKEHFAENPLTEKELYFAENLKYTFPLDEESQYTLYGSTLLCAVFYQPLDFWFALQIGDGACIALKANDTPFYPIPEDEKLGFGVTTSLCSKNAGEEFRYAFGFEKLNGIAVMTDGLTDSFSKEKLPDFILSIKKNAIADLETTKKELNAFLPRLSEQGSGDDISIAGIFIKELKKDEVL